MFASYRANVAVIYQNEMDRHFFATASHRPRRPRRQNIERMREQLRARWAERFARWNEKRAETSGQADSDR